MCGLTMTPNGNPVDSRCVLLHIHCQVGHFDIGWHHTLLHNLAESRIFSFRKLTITSIWDFYLNSKWKILPIIKSICINHSCLTNNQCHLINCKFRTRKLQISATLDPGSKRTLKGYHALQQKHRCTHTGALSEEVALSEVLHSWGVSRYNTLSFGRYRSCRTVWKHIQMDL